MHGVILGAKGNTRNGNVPAGEDAATAALVAKLLRRATNPETIGVWKWNGMVLHLYGYKTGKAGTENKHELPPPHDTVLLFGDSMILATKAGAIVEFGSAEFAKFYEDGHGGFEDLDSDDSESDEDEDEEEGEAVEEEEAVEESDTESDEEPLQPDAEEEEEVAPIRKVVVPPKPKRAGKKVHTWYNIPELIAEPYKLVKKEVA